MANRLFDVVFSILAMIILSPLFCLLALLIKLETPGPIFFVQERVGKDEKAFKIYKFRSMYDQHGLSTAALGSVKHDHSVVTRIGYWARRTKLDETPQFLNVLLGKMSLVGPRPCLFDRLPTMTPIERRRFQVLPGITGWAEVNGNVDLNWHEQVMLDIWYVDHRTLWLDFVILIKTAQTMLLGANKNDTALLKAMHHFEKMS